MIEIKFSIQGTHEGPTENPIPKLKMTGKQQWTPKARRYKKWKEHVVEALIKELERRSPAAAREAAKNYAIFGKPLVLATRRARMDIVIVWSDGTHGDPENIFGSIADALFHNDKYLAGSFDFKDEYGDGAVDILLTISEQRTWQQKPKPKRTTR
jgi:hypothetical protein